MLYCWAWILTMGLWLWELFFGQLHMFRSAKGLPASFLVCQDFKNKAESITSITRATLAGELGVIRIKLEVGCDIFYSRCVAQKMIWSWCARIWIKFHGTGPTSGTGPQTRGLVPEKRCLWYRSQQRNFQKKLLFILLGPVLSKIFLEL